MAKRNHTQDIATPDGVYKDRLLTVSLYPEPRPRLPWIRLCGLWLQQAGFEPQSRVRVRVMQGCLVITAE